MDNAGQWLRDLGTASASKVDGLVLVAGYSPSKRPPEEVAVMEKAKAYNAHSVFFEAGRNSRPAPAQAFIFLADDSSEDDDKNFAELHKRLWSWGGVPLLYRKKKSEIQLFRCAHRPDFVAASGELICKPIKTLKIAAAISSSEAWWDATRLRNGTLWDDPSNCRAMLSASKAAHKQLIDAIKSLNKHLNKENILKASLRRRLLILSILIAYLEEREAFPTGYFSKFLNGATKFFQVLANGKALLSLLDNLEERFNGQVFIFSAAEREALKTTTQLPRFAKLVEAQEEASGQLSLWKLYSFKDLPVELISHIYQLFVSDNDSSIYTPPFLVRLMLEEALSWERLDRIQERNEVILDPSCGSGVFLVEAFKRLVLHWRSRNQWKRPNVQVLKGLLKKVHGIDLEEAAVELAAFSLCLALCDALEPEELRASVKLFPVLREKSLHHSCFFKAKENELVKDAIGVVIGNPPFASKLSTPGAVESYSKYQANYGSLPDKQLAYLFLHEAMEMVAEGGILSMLQQYSFLYNQRSLELRRTFFTRWDVREVLDFLSVRGLFQKGGGDTKVVVVVAIATKPKSDRKILHAVFRRSGRIDAEQGFDIDYYDLHWLPRASVLNDDGIWRTNLLGGGRVTSLLRRLKQFRTLQQYAEDQGWDFGEGFIFGNPSAGTLAAHVVGKKFLPSSALHDKGLDLEELSVVPRKPIQRPRRKEIYSAPVLLIHKHMDLHHALWKDGYITYTHEVIGLSAARNNRENLGKLSAWLHTMSRPLQAFIACSSSTLGAAKATAILSGDILSLPYPEAGTLDLSANEKILVDDILDYYRDFVRLGDDADVMKKVTSSALTSFSNTFSRQINAIYKDNQLVPLEPQSWPGIVCQPFSFGKGRVDWKGAEELKDKLSTLITKETNALRVTRITRIYDGRFIFLLKPDRLRFWLRSIALRDADETFADLRLQESESHVG